MIVVYAPANMIADDHIPAFTAVLFAVAMKYLVQHTSATATDNIIKKNVFVKSTEFQVLSLYQCCIQSDHNNLDVQIRSEVNRNLEHAPSFDSLVARKDRSYRRIYYMQCSDT